MQKNIIRNSTIWLFLLLTLAPSVMAQTPQPPKEHKGYGYGYAGAFGNEGASGFTAGVGGDGLVYKGVSVGGDFTVLSPSLKWGRSFGVLAANGGYHFITSNGKVVPFVTGGPMAFFGDGVGVGFHVGGGVNYWFKERLGARFEYRMHRPLNTDLQAFHGFRVGITFR